MSRTPRNYNGTAGTSKHVQHVLRDVLKNVRKKQQLQPEAILVSWKALIGPQLASMTNAEKFEEGVLFVKVSNSTLFSLLNQHEKPKILATLRSKFPNAVIKSIVFRMG